MSNQNPQGSESDPVQFVGEFRLSLAYQRAFEQFFAGKELSNDTTEQEKIEAFERSTAAKDALIDYAEQERHFTYCPELLTHEARAKMEEYVSLVRSIHSVPGLSRDEIEEMDRTRSLRHISIARQLVADSVVPNVLLGRVVARLVLISEGLETYNDARAMR